MATAIRSLIGLGLGISLFGVASSCGSKASHPVGPPPQAGPIELVTPESGPSALQRQLAAMTPAAAEPESAASERLDQALADYRQRARSHRGYLAVDKPLYRPGETIWFRAFDLFSAELTGDPATYGTDFQLISPKGAVVMEKRAMTREGAAANDFVIPAGVPGGEYVLKAITDQGTEVERSVIVAAYQPPRIKKKLEFVRKAYGAGDTVAAAIALNRATGEPLAKKEVTGLVVLDGGELVRVPVTTDDLGKAVVRFDLPAQIARGDGLLTILVEDGGVTESIQKRIPITLDKLQFAMFPEGGDLVAGLPGRVYFSAKNLIDKPADVEGRVVDDRDQLVARFRSVHDGMGRFEMTPMPGHTYRVEITRPVGIASTFELPRPLEAGCSMQVIDDVDSKRDDIRVAVWCSRERDVVATAVLRDQRLGTRTVKVPAGRPAVVVLPAPATGQQGAVRVTLFDRNLAPMAERLIYRNRNADLKVKITADRDRYHPRDKVTLAVETRGVDGSPVAADLALSVVDDTVLSFADDKSANLMARLYLESEMPGQKIEEPNFYFSDDPLAAAGLDCVLGTQGWRRFDWKLVFVPPAPIDTGWGFTGEYWNDELGFHRFARAAGKKGGEGDEAEKTKAVDRDFKKLPGKVVAKQEAAPNGMEDEDGPPEREEMMMREPMAAPAPMMDALAGADFDGEMVVLEAQAGWAGDWGGADNFRGERGRRIRDKDWGIDGNEQKNWNWSPVREFPVPNYDARYDGPRVDFRDTIFWKPQVQTDASGKAEVSFYLSDAVTSFRATAEGMGGGSIGRGEALVMSKLPVSLAVKMPLEVSSGDRITLPITVANETDQAYQAKLQTRFGPAFESVGGTVPETVELAANQRKSFFYQLAVVGNGADPDAGKMLVAVEAANLRDQVEQTVKVAPPGFPQEVSIAGTAEKGERNRHEILISDIIPGTLQASLTMYPSPLATMVEGTSSMLREPCGCFEQASSSNYPNIMILDYLEQHDAAEPELVDKTQGMLDRGYQKLTGYESKSKGYEWFGGDPGHEALSAYGLMEFMDMTKVYDVDQEMVARTARWLKGRRDGKGGFLRNPQAIDSFGAASPEVTDAYITYALAEAETGGIEREVKRQAQSAEQTADPYLLALAANTLVDAKNPGAPATLRRLIGMQAEDGSFPGADHSITRSGGEALIIETTALASLAMMHAGSQYLPQVRRAIEWLNDHRDGYGGYGSTQSTVLALKAMTAYAEASRVTQASGTATIYVDGEQAGQISYEKGHQGALVFDLSKHIHSGKNRIEVELDSSEPLPYSVAVSFASKVPASSPETKVSLATRIDKRKVAMGEGVRIHATVKNLTEKGVPMTLARVGIPGGLTFQTWQLKELRDKKLIAFYETREREIVLYFRSLAPGATRDVDLDLLAQVPGTYTAPASQAYLYYTDEHRNWVAPVKIEVTR